MNVRALTLLATGFLIGSAFAAIGCSDDDENGAGGSSSGGGTSGGTSGDGTSGGTSSGGTDGGTSPRYWYVTNGGLPQVSLADLSGADLFNDETPGAVVDIAIGGGSLWALTDEAKLLRYDLAAPAKPEVFEGFAKNPSHLAYGGGAVWITEDDNDTGSCEETNPSSYVIRWDPATKAVVKTFPIVIDTSACDRFEGVVATDTSVFALNNNGFGVGKIDIATNAVTKTVALGEGGGYGIGSMRLTSDALWVLNKSGHFLFRFDRDSLEQKSKTALPEAFDFDMTATTQAVFITDPDANLIRVDAADPTKQEQKKLPTSKEQMIGVRGTTLYVAGEQDGLLAPTMIAIDPTSLTEQSRVEVPALSDVDHFLFQD